MLDKQPHGIIGARLYKDGKHYVMEFEEFKEKSIYGDYESLTIDMNRLGDQK